MGRRLVQVLAIFAVGAGVFAFYALARDASRGGESMPLFSTRRYDPYGTAALHELLRATGHTVRRLDEPHIPRQQRGVLIQVLGVPVQEAQELEELSLWGKTPYALSTQELRAWAAEGNTIIQFSRGQTDLMEAMGVSASPRRRAQALRIQQQQISGAFPDEVDGRFVSAQWTDQGSALFGVGSAHAPLTLRAPRPLRVEATGVPLARADEDAVAVLVPFGKGRFVFVGAPYPVLNQGLEQGGNLDFLLAIIGHRPVLIDEWSHGIGHADTIMELIVQAGLWPVFLQVGFAVLLYVWSTRGVERIEVDEAPRRASSTEQVRTLGHLYRQTLSGEESLARARREIWRRLADGLNCSAQQLARGRVALSPPDREAVRCIRQDLAAVEQRDLESELGRLLTEAHRFAQEKRHDRRTAFRRSKP